MYNERRPDTLVTRKPKREKYLGSVRFFKNMILLCVIVMIAVPLSLAVKYRSDAVATMETVSELELQIEEQNKTIRSAQQRAQYMMPLAAEVSDSNIADTADPPAYQELYPDFYAPQDYNAVNRRENTIFLTFDDGPTIRTEEVLDILAEKEVKATFFVVHHDEEQTAERLRRIVDEGHTLAMHSYSHRYSTIYGSVETFLDDMYKLFVEIRETTGYTPTLFRFPGGSINAYNAAVYQEMISEMIRRGFVPYDWNLSAEDAVSPPPPTETLVSNILNGVRNVKRGVVLMHDSFDKRTTVEALPLLIDELRNRGFELDRLTSEDIPVLYSYKDN